MNPAKKIFTIPAGAPFAKSLAERLLKDTEAQPEILSSYRIFLPTRRACATLKDAFLSLSDAPLLLPRLQPLGDIDEEELSLSLAGIDESAAMEILNLPPAIAPLRRQILLARTIERLPDFTRGFDQALELAIPLARFMDQIYTEGLRLENLATLAPEEFADHWQITIKFLEILSQAWPQILAEEGLIDAADRRNRLMRALAQFWTNDPPTTPIIAAGSTGSIAATAELLNVIAALPQGCVILPGLDQSMAQEDWDVLADTHPQSGMKKLLEHFNVDRAEVKLWPHQDNDAATARRALISEAMRPAERSDAWTHLGTNAMAKKTFHQALENLSIYECAHEREESEIIAALLRGALETPGKTAALVTPDRALARRVAMACRRWNITIDDSAGQTLDQTSLGCFLRLIAQAAINDFAPISLLSLLKHDLCALAHSHEVSELDKILRGPKPHSGLSGIFERIDEKNNLTAHKLLEHVEPILKKFIDAIQSKTDFKILLKAHLETAESLAKSPENLWSGDDGEEAAALFSSLFDHASNMPALVLRDYAAALTSFMRTITIRPAYGGHPRLTILGQLEARLIGADFIIMGLNENVWPNDSGHDPWMSRPMRADFGLPAKERDVGLAAHDFAQGFCAPQVAITHARRRGGAPAIPSRWLRRIDTVLDAAGIDKNAARDFNVPAWIHAMDTANQPTPHNRPAPTPPLNQRPRRMPATRIETWKNDPYGIYARYILKLKKLDPLEKTPDALDRGNLLHNILEKFVKTCPNEIPKDAINILRALADQELALRHEDPSAWSFWKPRFSKIAAWLVDYETAWRETARPMLTELRGAITLNAPGGAFIIEAKPDRIDKTVNGAVIIDYKSGGAFTKKAIENGDLPQLSVEGLILSKGGFSDTPALPIVNFEYWVLTGGEKSGDIIASKENPETILQRAEAGLIDLIAAFDDPTTPYFSVPDPGKAPRFNDYEHLARIKEWAVLNDSDSSEAA